MSVQIQMYLHRHICLDRQDKLKGILPERQIRRMALRIPSSKPMLSKNQIWHGQQWPEGWVDNGFRYNLTPISWVPSIQTHETVVSIRYRTKFYFGGQIFQWNFDKWYSRRTKRASLNTFHMWGWGVGRGNELWFWVDSMIVTVHRSSWMLGQEMQCVNPIKRQKVRSCWCQRQPENREFASLSVTCDFSAAFERGTPGSCTCINRIPLFPLANEA